MEIMPFTVVCGMNRSAGKPTWSRCVPIRLSKNGIGKSSTIRSHAQNKRVRCTFLRCGRPALLRKGRICAGICKAGLGKNMVKPAIIQFCPPHNTSAHKKSSPFFPISSYNEFGTDYNPIQNESHRRKQWINKSRPLKI